MRWIRKDPLRWRRWFAWYPVTVTVNVNDEEFVRVGIWFEWIEYKWSSSNFWTRTWRARIDKTWGEEAIKLNEDGSYTIHEPWGRHGGA